jgi:hypothetical protein
MVLTDDFPVVQGENIGSDILLFLVYYYLKNCKD